MRSRFKFYIEFDDCLVLKIMSVELVIWNYPELETTVTKPDRF